MWSWTVIPLSLYRLLYGVNAWGPWFEPLLWILPGMGRGEGGPPGASEPRHFLSCLHRQNPGLSLSPVLGQLKQNKASRCFKSGPEGLQPFTLWLPNILHKAKCQCPTLNKSPFLWVPRTFAFNHWLKIPLLLLTESMAFLPSLLSPLFPLLLPHQSSMILYSFFLT